MDLLCTSSPYTPLSTIHKDIAMVPHTSTLTPTDTVFCMSDILERSLHGFSIILSKKYAIYLFSIRLRISHLYLVEQQNRKLQLI